MEIVCKISRCVIVFFSCSCVTAMYLFYFVLKVLCCNICNVFVDSFRKGDTAVDAVGQRCLVIKLGLQLKKKNRTAFPNFRTSLYHKMTGTGGAVVTVMRLLRAVVSVDALRLWLGIALRALLLWSIVTAFYFARLPNR